jgi:hypothetical protein
LVWNVTTHRSGPFAIVSRSLLRIDGHNSRVGRRVGTAAGAIALVMAVLAALAPSASAGPTTGNPCLDPDQTTLLCPDLQMSPPFGLKLDTRVVRGRVVLRAGNSINSVGLGPASLQGRRTSYLWMNAAQLIHRRGARPLRVNTGARLYFKYIPGQGRYWKYYNAAKFELWRLDEQGRRVRRVRTGPKVIYCLRDLKRTRPGPRSPRTRRFPACSRNSRLRSVTLGTSVGWSDIYPETYHEQWIDVTGLRGCYDLVHIVDPGNHILELDESNNESYRTVQLPFNRRRGAGRCFSSGPVNQQPEDDVSGRRVPGYR